MFCKYTQHYCHSCVPWPDPTCQRSAPVLLHSAFESRTRLSAILCILVTMACGRSAAWLRMTYSSQR